MTPPTDRSRISIVTFATLLLASLAVAGSLSGSAGAGRECQGGSVKNVCVTLSPVSGTVLANVTLVATPVAVNGVAGVTFLVDGTQLGSEVAASPYVKAWNTQGVPNGDHTISAIARDSAGRTS